MMEKCSQFDSCNAPICPLDKEANLRIKLPEDDICPFCRTRKNKGIRKTISEKLRKLVPEENIGLLSYKNR